MKTVFLLAALLLPVTARAQDAAPVPQKAEDRLKTLEERVSQLEGAPAKTSLSAFNPAMGLALDGAMVDRDARASFLLRTAELNIESSIDPFLKGWTIINASNSGVDLEEVALQTTALPHNLQVTGGRLFASFGRLGHFHDHELPVIERPNSLDTFIGGETEADGVELSFLLPTRFYANVVLGAYNKLGAQNDRADNATGRGLDRFTYLGRASAYADLGDDHSVELGLHSAWTPKRSVEEDVSVTGSGVAAVTTANTWRALSGADLTYRYQPAQGGLYRGLVWGTEVVMNNERRFDPSTRLPTDRVRAFGGFSYIQAKMGRRWRPGVMLDLAESLDNGKALTRTFTGFLTWDLTEFQRLRLSYSHAANNIPGRSSNHIVALQWTGVLGHHVHGFRDR
ncbi:MAG: hypothetical protein HY921_07050 [Elusimicrobia bacterium]|nr:hypothetical protein [Elusimicrobiota bacterium]